MIKLFEEYKIHFLFENINLENIKLVKNTKRQNAYKILLNNLWIGDFDINTEEDDICVEVIYISDKYRNNGISKMIYILGNILTKKMYNKTLHSSYMYNLNKGSIGIWKSLVNDGLAEKIGDRWHFKN